MVVFVPWDPASAAGRGQLLFRNEGTLMAQPFDDRTLVLSGEPVPVAAQLGSFLGGTAFSAHGIRDVLGASRTSSAASQEFATDLVQSTRDASRQLGEPGGAAEPDPLAGCRGGRRPSGSMLSGNSDLWLLDLVPGTSTRLTFGPSFVTSPAGLRTGSRVVFRVEPGRWSLRPVPEAGQRHRGGRGPAEVDWHQDADELVA